MEDKTVASACGCGSCEDAVRAALRHFDIMKNGDDCVTYNLRVAAALVSMVIADFKNEMIKDVSGVDVAARLGETLPPDEGVAVVMLSGVAEDRAHMLADYMRVLTGNAEFGAKAIDVIMRRYVAEETTKAH